MFLKAFEASITTKSDCFDVNSLTDEQLTSGKALTNRATGKLHLTKARDMGLVGLPMILYPAKVQQQARNHKFKFVVICTQVRHCKYTLIMHGFSAFHFLYAQKLNVMLKVRNFQKSDIAGT